MISQFVWKRIGSRQDKTAHFHSSFNVLREPHRKCQVKSKTNGCLIYFFLSLSEAISDSTVGWATRHIGTWLPPRRHTLVCNCPTTWLGWQTSTTPCKSYWENSKHLNVFTLWPGTHISWNVSPGYSCPYSGTMYGQDVYWNINVYSSRKLAALWMPMIRGGANIGCGVPKRSHVLQPGKTASLLYRHRFRTNSKMCNEIRRQGK